MDFLKPRNSQDCSKFLDDPPIHDHIHDVLGGLKIHAGLPFRGFVYVYVYVYSPEHQQASCPIIGAVTT